MTERVNELVLEITAWHDKVVSFLKANPYVTLLHQAPLDLFSMFKYPRFFQMQACSCSLILCDEAQASTDVEKVNATTTGHKGSLSMLCCIGSFLSVGE